MHFYLANYEAESMNLRKSYTAVYRVMLMFTYLKFQLLYVFTLNMAISRRNCPMGQWLTLSSLQQFVTKFSISCPIGQ